MTNEEIGRRLDKIIAILQLAHYETIEASRATLHVRQDQRDDPRVDNEGVARRQADPIGEAEDGRVGKHDQAADCHPRRLGCA